MQADLTISMEINESVQQVPTPPGIQDIPNDLLELVLLQVPTPACLLRAAATCKVWRRVITGDGFLHRYRSIHGPRLVLGHYAIDYDDSERGDERVRTDFIPSPPRPATAATRLYQRVSLDFLPRAMGPYTKLLPTDSRGGLLAVVNGTLWKNLVVCNPWTRQYRAIHIPWTRPVFAPEDGYCEHNFLGAFLLGGGADDDDETTISMSNFRVVYARMVHDDFNNRVTTQAYVYSARDGRFLVLAPPIGPGVGFQHFGWSRRTLEMFNRFMGRAGGSLFWAVHCGQVLQLDESTVEFSTLALPLASNDSTCMLEVEANYDRGNLRVVGGGARGAVHIVRIVDSDLEVFTRAYGDRECVLHKRFSLWQLSNLKQDRPERQRWGFWETPSSGALRLMVSSTSSEFSIDVETMELERISETTYQYAADLLLPYEVTWPHKISDVL
ncbi:unnamed protein product [Urochloa decumbens]|uniref:F-box domain-containing protein n=1 Tax=Urochloa decumbens TaxID=240449 RepID=A0ABC9A037_9POAL